MGHGDTEVIPDVIKFHKERKELSNTTGSLTNWR
jgi:hypothetical protein